MRFSASSANMISQFMDHLKGPVCLVAHNGIKYDFPLLLSEFSNVGEKLCDNLFVVDSLEAFRKVSAGKVNLHTINDPLG